jgi:hypothetical protein
VTARFTRYGVRIPDADVHAAEDGTVVIQADDSPVVRWRTSEVVPVPLPVPHDYSGAA